MRDGSPVEAKPDLSVTALPTAGDEVLAARYENHCL